MAEASAIGIDGWGYEVDAQKCATRSTEAWSDGCSIAKKVTPILRDWDIKHPLKVLGRCTSENVRDADGVAMQKRCDLHEM
jgi:hypothetical protein